MVKALVLEKKGELTIRNIDLPLSVGDDDVKIAIHTVGICGSDVHYYEHGAIGPFVVKEPMVLGHEASGIVTEVGKNVKHLFVGSRVSMEPGIPNFNSKAYKLGIYNTDPHVRFWATPPIHGCLTPEVVHPANFTFQLPDNVSFAAGAMVEPLAVGMQATAKAKVCPGDVALVIGAGPIGIMTALTALAGGCAKVYISDIVAEKLTIAGQYDGVIPIDATQRDVADVIKQETSGWGADVVLECAGANPAITTALSAVSPGGVIVFVGMPTEHVHFDMVLAQSKEIRMETVFRYANMYDRTIELLASGKIDLTPLITETFNFDDSIAAFDRALEKRLTDVKLQIVLDKTG